MVLVVMRNIAAPRRAGGAPLYSIATDDVDIVRRGVLRVGGDGVARVFDGVGWEGI